MKPNPGQVKHNKNLCAGFNVLGVRVRREEAERVRQELKRKGLLLPDYHPIREGDFVIFPVRDRVEGFEVVEREFVPRKRKPRNILEALRPILGDLAEGVTKSFDIIGHVAVIRLPEEFRKYEKEIAEAIMAVHPNVRTVAVEEGPHQGVYRVQPVRVVAGEKQLVTIYRENGVELELEVGKVYFSPRLSYERARIAQLVKPNEFIAALFAGVGPFPIVIQKKQPSVRQYAVEINPIAYKYLVRNVERNRMVGKIIPVLGDVRDVVPRMFPGMADRVLMPLPKGAYQFLDVAMLALKPKGGFIHFYHFAPEEDPYTEAEALVFEAAEKFGRRAEVVGRRIVRPYAPHVVQVVLDVFIR